MQDTKEEDETSAFIEKCRAKAGVQRRNGLPGCRYACVDMMNVDQTGGKGSESRLQP